jgi:hypothetical protein
MRVGQHLPVAVAFCLGVFAASEPKAQEGTEGTDSPRSSPPDLRLHLEAGLGADLYRSMQMPDGSRASPSCSSGELIPLLCKLIPALDLGIDWSPVEAFGAGLHARWLPALRGGASTLGRRLDILEVLLVPQVRLPWPWRFPRGGARPYLAAPLGVAWSFQSKKWERAVNESWNSRPGLSAGAALGLELFWGPRWGTLFELDYRARFLSSDVVSTPLDEPALAASERVTVTQHQLVFSVGVVLGLRHTQSRPLE